MKTRLLLFATLGLVLTHRVDAQAPLPLYTDDLVNGSQSWSWAIVNFSSTNVVHSGSYAISVDSTNYEALWIHTPNFSTAHYTNLSFWINGGAGGQSISVAGIAGGNPQTSYLLPNLAAHTWQQFTIPLSTLGVANVTNCNGFWWQVNYSGQAPTFYVDDVQVNPLPPPALMHIVANAAAPIRTADSRWFGINTAIWDNTFDTTATVSLLKDSGLQFLRFPGGSASDEYNWVSNTSLTNTWQWATSLTNFAHVATNLGAQVIITANYGTGTPVQAAAWVKNVWNTNHYNFKYWEIGNENYGLWETDSNTYPHDPYTYANRAQTYFTQMRAASTNIKIGVVVTTGEDNNANGYSAYPATNLVTHQVHYGWTPVVLSRLKQLGVTPDFLIYHWYPQSGSDSDPILLGGTGNWIGDAANLRAMVSNYFGSGGTNIELLITENNSDSGPLGKQSTSLVNAIYYADSFGQMTHTEFNSFVWWDLRNGEDTTGDLDPVLYGWRQYGDLGILDGIGTSLTNRYPAYFAIKLLQHFARGGDTIVSASTDYDLLSACSARRTNGSMTLLVINKNAGASFTSEVNIAGFTPDATATVYSYGMAQDNAAEAGSTNCDIAQSNYSPVSGHFVYSFPQYSLTLFSFAPAAPSLQPVLAQSGANRVVLQLGGQSGTPYVLQSSTNLSTWTSVSTNYLTASTMNITNALVPGTPTQFWRAVWKP